jgi:hypothetical protein
MVEKVLGDVALWYWPYFGAKSSHEAVDVDGLVYPLHHPMTCSRHIAVNVIASRGPDSGGAYPVPSWVTGLGHNRHPLVP